MKLVTFGIDKERNLIIQFPVFIQPYMQQPLILYQIETVPVPNIDQNTQAHSYTHLQIDKCARAQLISQHVDAGQLNILPQQQPITLSLTKVTVVWTLDKLAHNAASQPELWKLGKVSQGSSKLDKLSQSQWGNLRYKGSQQAPKQQSESIETESRRYIPQK